jgi:hypothetical protein
MGGALCAIVGLSGLLAVLPEEDTAVENVKDRLASCSRDDAEVVVRARAQMALMSQ